MLRVKANRSETEGVVLLIVWNARSPKVSVWNNRSPNSCHSPCDHCFPCFKLRSNHHQMFFIHMLIWTNFDNFDRVTVIHLQQPKLHDDDSVQQRNLKRQPQIAQGAK